MYAPGVVLFALAKREQGLPFDEHIAVGRYTHFIDRAYRLDDHTWGIFSLERLARTPEFRQAAA